MAYKITASLLVVTLLLGFLGVGYLPTRYGKYFIAALCLAGIAWLLSIIWSMP